MSIHVYKEIGKNENEQGQEDFIKYTDESKLNELLWRINNNTIVRHIYDYMKSDKIYNDLSDIIITSTLHKNKKQEVSGYIAYHHIPNAKINFRPGSAALVYLGSM